MQLAQFAYGLLVKLAGIRCFVEVEISAENLVCSLAAQNHFYAHALYYTSQKIHRSACANSCNVVCLNKIDNIADGVETFLNGIVYLVMNRSDVLGNFLSLGKVGSTLQTYGERVQARPPRIALAFLLDALMGKFLGYGRDYRAVETAREQNAVRHIAHQLSLYG